MGQRLIRDDMLDSEAVLACPPAARWFFVSILLQADDIGLFEATPFKLARKADIDRDKGDEYLATLERVDLIRRYVVDGKAYGFIPKFRQRLQIKRAKHPLPPLDLLRGDEDALRKIKHLGSDPTVDHGVPQLGTAGQPSEPEPEPEGKRTARSAAKRPTAAPIVPACPYEGILERYHHWLPNLPSVKLTQGKMWEKRQKAMRELWTFVLTSSTGDGKRRAENTAQGLAWFDRYFERATQNAFIMGRTRPGQGHENWRADFDYLLSPKGLKQVMELTESS